MFFKDIIGQEAAKQHLIETAQSGRIAHAQIFLGKEGSGNLALALAFAQYALCENPSDTDSCGQCAACVKNSKFIHPDLHFSYPTIGGKLSTEFLPKWRSAMLANPYLNGFEWLQKLDAENKQGNITAKECDDIMHKLTLKIFEGKYKVLLLWLPEYLGKEGNRLLKLIEEPPEDTLFLLVAENQELILNTILSRCQLVNIQPLDDASIITALMNIHQLTAERATEIAYLADGNYNEALTLLHQQDTNLTDEFLRWFRIAFKGQPTEMVAWAEDISKWGREQQKHFLRYVLFFLREYIVFTITQQPSPRLRAKEQTAANGMLKVIGFEQVEPISTLLNESIFYVERNANPKILFLDACVQLKQLLHRKN